jgi:FkbM family methyltransferase
MAKIVEQMLVGAYGLVRRSGVLDTRTGWIAYATAYRAYKRAVDRELIALQRFVEAGSLVFDVGANVGSSTLMLARWTGPQGRVVAIEPEARNAAELRRIVAASRLSGVVDVVEAAASDRSGEVKLAINSDNPGDHRLSETGLRIPAFSLDDLGSRYPDRMVSVIKIDVQGAEPQVIAGATRVIAEHRPVIMMELFGEGLAAFGQTPAGMVMMMADLGYAAFLAEGDALQAASSEEIAGVCLKDGYKDALFLPRDNRLRAGSSFA